MDACTIVSPRELARARVLARSLSQHAPAWRLTALVLGERPAAEEGFVLMGLNDLASGDEWGLIAATNPPSALGIALLPLLVKILFAHGADAAVYLGAGQRVLGAFVELEELLQVNQTVLLARPLAAGGRERSFAADLVGGVFSRALIGLRRGTSSEALLEAWPRSFADGLGAGEAAVRRWLDSIPALSESVGMLRDPGYGLDPVSLGSLPLAEQDGRLEAGGRPARLIDFSELDPLDPSACFQGEGRARLSTKPVLAALVERQAADLLAAGYEQDANRALALDRLPDGLRLSQTIRELIVEALRDGELDRSPFTDAGRRQLYKYLNAPGEQGRYAGLTRLHLAIWHMSPELKEGYPHLTGPDGTGFAGWLCSRGVDQLGLVPELLPPAPDIVFRDADPHRHLLAARWGVNLVGFFTAELGVGEAARLLITSLDARTIPALPIQGNLAPPSRQGAEHWFVRPEQASYPINIICINGDGLAVFAREAGRSFFADRYTVGVWWWEVGDPPADWRPAYEFVDEVWVATEHIYNAIAPLSPVPVVRITLPVIEPEVAPASRGELGLPPDEFIFLYVHDYHSVAARKNPDGLIEAFKRAFEPGAGPKLVIKSINAATRPEEHDRVLLAAAARPDILLIDGYVSGPEKNAMIAHCDCYVSLHRSEGFGLTLAEALMLERPVIATRYGGAQDFLDDSNAFLVDWRPVPVGEGAYPYPADGIWAEPDLDQAAALMTEVFAHPDQARGRAREGRRKLLEHYSPAAAGAVVERRLRFIYDERLPADAHTIDLAQLPPALAKGQRTLPEHRRALEEHIAHVPQLALGNGLSYKIRTKLMRPLVTWARLYSQHQADLERDLQREIVELEERMLGLDEYVREVGLGLQEGQQELRAQLLARIRQLEG